MNRKEKLMEEIDVLIDLTEVHSSINDITKDFIYANLEGSNSVKDRDLITEFVAQTQFCTELIRSVKDKYHEWEWNNKEKKWEEKKLEELDNKGEIIKSFNSNISRLNRAFMIRPYMKCILHRNKPNNYMLDLLGKNHLLEEQKELEKNDNTRMDQLKELVKEKFNN